MDSLKLFIFFTLNKLLQIHIFTFMDSGIFCRQSNDMALYGNINAGP